MELSPDERGAILAGEHPTLIRVGKECPFEFAEQITLRTIPSLAGPVAQVSITIIGWKRGKKGEWIPEYSVRDDRPLYLRHNSGSTRSSAESVDPEAPITDPVTLKRYAAQGRLSKAQREANAEEAQRKRERAVRERLRETMKGLTPEAQVSLLAGIEREIVRASNTSERAA